MDTHTTITYHTLVDDLAKSAETLRREEPAGEISPRVSHLRVSLFYLFVLAFTLGSLYSAWHGNSWYDLMWYWGIVGVALLAELLIFWGVWHAFRVRARSSETPDALPRPTLKMLYSAALVGDDELAPPVLPEKMSSDSSMGSAVDLEIFEVAPPQRRLRLETRLAAGFAGLAMLVGVLTSLPLFGGSLKWQALVAFPPIAALNFWRFASETRQARTLKVETRADGLHWGTRAHRECSLPWSELRGWYIASLPQSNIYSSGQTTIIYAAVGEHKSLTWLSLRQPRWQARATPALDAGELLARQVQAHVSLPLRDLTPGVGRIIAERKRHPQPTLRLDPRVTGPVSYLRLHPASMLIVGVTLLTLAAGVLMPYAQQRYFGGQLAQLDAAKSAIRAPLTADMLHWMPAPSDNPSQRFLFTPSGYVFPTDACCDLNSRVAQPMSNGLVEVTAHQQSQFDLATVGILYSRRRGRSQRTGFHDIRQRPMAPFAIHIWRRWLAVR